MGYLIKKTLEFDLWFLSQGPKNKSIINKRFINVEVHGHFGDIKKVRTGAYDISEFRFKNGTRVYFAFIVDDKGNAVLILTGGNKNGQSKDIKASEKIISTWYETIKSAFARGR